MNRQNVKRNAFSAQIDEDKTGIGSTITKLWKKNDPRREETGAGLVISRRRAGGCRVGMPIFYQHRAHRSVSWVAAKKDGRSARVLGEPNSNRL
jgi:hypothetical protein